MSIEAMKLALAALETCRIRSVSEWSVEDITPKNVTAAIAALRTAIQQAEAKTDVRCEGCGYMTHHREHMGCVRAAKQFTHPESGVPEKLTVDPSGVSGTADEGYVAGWNACRAAITQAAESEPVAGPTTYQQRFTEVVSLLCRAAPPADMVEGWLTPDADDHRLQEWAIEHAPNWSQGIGVLDAAHQMADQPTEGGDHEPAQQPATPDDVVRDAERGRFLVGWLKRFGLLQTEFGQIGAGEKPENWWLLHAPWGIDKTRPFFGHGKTPEQAIDAAMLAAKVGGKQ